MYVRVAIDHGFEMVEGVPVDQTLYVASISGQSLASCDVYVQRSPCWLPAVRARRLGCFGELFERDVFRLVHEPYLQDPDGVLSAMFPVSQLFWFSQNYRGGVDCYVLSSPGRRQASSCTIGLSTSRTRGIGSARQTMISSASSTDLSGLFLQFPSALRRRRLLARRPMASEQEIGSHRAAKKGPSPLWSCSLALSSIAYFYVVTCPSRIFARFASLPSMSPPGVLRRSLFSISVLSLGSLI